MQQLIKQGANINDQTEEASFLELAIRYENDVSTIDLMLQYGANPDRDIHGGTPLNWAVFTANRTVVQCLLRHHANPNKHALLKYAEKHHMTEIARLLRDAGAKR